MDMPHRRSLEELIDLARDKSSDSRALLVATIGDLYFGERKVLTEQERAMMTDIIERLIRDLETSVRRALAERFANEITAPESLVFMLANDDIEVAYPILVKSEVLQDIELIEIIRYRTMEHRLAIAARPRLKAPVTDTLVKSGNADVIVTLLENKTAQISIGAFDHLTRMNNCLPQYHGPLVNRGDLPQALAKRLYWGVSAALREHILANFNIDPGDLDETIDGTVNDLIDSERFGQEPSPRKSTHQEKTEDVPVLVTLLDEGRVSRFLDTFAKRTGLRMTLIRRILFEEGGEGLAIACRAIGLDRKSFVSIFNRFRQGRLGDKALEHDEILRALAFFDQTDMAVAKGILRRWHRNPEYLNALRLVREAKE